MDGKSAKLVQGLRSLRARLMCAVLTVPFALAACSPKPVLKPPPKLSAKPETSYRQLVPKDVPRYTLAPGEKVVQPILQKRVTPTYPATLVHVGAPPVTMIAQLVMDKDGRVRGVFIQSNSDRGVGRGLFDGAVRHAAMQWTFTPLWVQQPKRDGMYLLTTKPFSLWFEFRFTVVNGKPVVEAVKR